MKPTTLYEVLKMWAKAKNFALHLTPEIDSTQLWALQSFEPSGSKDEFSPVIFAAESQTAGIGRKPQRTWLGGGPGDSLLTTWAYQTHQLPCVWLSLRVGTAVLRSLEISFGLKNIELKLPNDILLSEKKCAGIRMDARNHGNRHHIFVGLGLNVFERVWPSDLVETATCLEAHVARDDMTQSLTAFFDALHLELKRALFEPLDPELERATLIKFGQKTLPWKQGFEFTKEGNILFPSLCVPWSLL